VLLDQFGQEIKNTRANTDEFATLEKDIDVFAGWIRRLENPDPVLRSEAAGRGLRLYDEVDRDAHAGSVLQQRCMAVIGKEWEIQPAETLRGKGRPGTTTKEQAQAAFVAQVLMDCNFDQARQELVKAVLYGFYNVEIIWRYISAVPGSHGSIGIQKLIGKHPRRFIFTPARELRLITLQSMIEGEAVPERKFVTFTYGDSDNPYGCGLGRRLWWPVWFKKHGIKFWMVFLEKFGMPTIVGKYPPGTAKTEQDKLLDVISAIQTDTGITVPDNTSLEFLEASRAGGVTHEQLCEYMDKQISKAVLGQTATTEGTPGKLGNDQAQADVRQEIIEADADLLDGCLNDTLIKWIVDYNFPGVAAYPKIKTYAGPKPDLKVRSEVDKTLVVDIGLPITKKYFYDMYGVPEPQPGDDLVTPVKAATVPDQLQSVIPEKSGIQEKQFAEVIDPTDAWIDFYMKHLAPHLSAAREGALEEIEAWLKSLPVPPDEAEFVAHIEDTLGASAAKAIGSNVITDAVAQIYAAFRETPGVNLSFGGPDIRAVNFLGKLDHFYTSSWLKNPDAQSVMRSFIQERYLEKGAGLFGRGNPEDIAEFRNLLGQKVADLEDWQIRRIVETSVQRTRNWASLSQMNEGRVTQMEVYEPTQDCAFCASMNGKVISVATAYSVMERQANMTPDEYEADLRQINAEMNRLAQAVDRIEYSANAGRIPPYHPHCRGRIIKKVSV